MTLCGGDSGCGFKFISHGISKQHPNLEQYKGVKCNNADACFASEFAIGVADGLSGVLKHGIDPSLLSHELMDLCQENCNNYFRDPSAFEQNLQNIYRKNNVPSVLDDEDVNAGQVILITSALACDGHGACTALLCTFDETRTQLHTISVGDSGMLVLRRQKIGLFGPPYYVAYKSVQKQHSAGTPVQFHRMPPDLPKPEHLLHFLNGFHGDLDITEFPLEVGDVIVGGSDGLFDNLFDSEVCEIVSEFCDVDDLPNGVPDCPVHELCYAVHQASVDAAAPDNTEMTPFSQKLSEDEGKNIIGGHPDDMTVVVAFVAHANL